jgi:hypothetical protein
MSAYFSTLAKICQKVKLKAENVVILGGLISIARKKNFKSLDYDIQCQEVTKIQKDAQIFLFLFFLRKIWVILLWMMATFATSQNLPKKNTKA